MSDEEALKIARTQGKERIAKSGSTRALLGLLTSAMKLDLVFFGHVESGPFFALLERKSNPEAPDPRSSAFAKATADKPTSDPR